MGRVICSKHAESGMVLTCSHLSKTLINFNKISEFVKRVEKRKEFDWDWIYCICKQCDEEYKETKMNEFPSYFLKPACAKCFLELSDLETWY